MKTQKYLTGVITFLLCAVLYSHGTETRPVTLEEYGGVAGNRQQDLQVETGLTPQEMWEVFFTDTLPAGVTMTKIEYIGKALSSGKYWDMPSIDNISPKDGLLLTSGKADTAKGPNDDVGATWSSVAAGDMDLQDIAGDNVEHFSYDASVFTIEFTTDTSIKGFTFDFVFGSEEYDEWVGMFNDAFCTFFDGENICYDNQGNLITVNNAFFQIDNLNASINLQYDGFTCVLRTADTLVPGPHTLKFVISDIRDRLLDSGVFLHNFRFDYTGQGTNPVKELIGNQQFSVMENSPAGTFVGEVQLTAPDTMDITLNVLQDVPEFDFDVNSRIITVANGADLDYEKQNIYYLVLEATAYDSIHDTATITINILDYNVGDLISDQTFYVKEKSPVGTFVGEVEINVADSFDVSVTVIQGVPEFDFDGGTREITVASGADLDYEKQDTYYMTMLAQAKEAQDDTALITIKILDSLEIPDPPDIDNAVMYDKNGDGIGDSAHVVFKNSIDAFKPHEADLEWPDNGPSYDLSIQPSQVNGRELSLPFTPANNAGVLTTGVGNVSVFFDSVGNSFTRESTVLDGIGPLLKDTAYVVERFGSGVDTFIVTFTEDVSINKINGKSFILLKDGREITVEVIAGVQSITGEIEISFAADLKGETPLEGDSLKILHTGPVADKRTNAAHKDNTPVPIAILKRPVPVTSASYYDTDGDGIVDQVRVTFKKEIDNPQSLKATFTWEGSGEDGTVDGLEYYSNSDHTVCKAAVKDIFGILLRDRTSGEMTMLLEYKDFQGTTASHSVSDKAGPVITAATYCPNGDVNQNGEEEGPDTLVVSFSEDVNEIGSPRPFDLLAIEDNDFYHLELKQMAYKIKLIFFEVEDIVDTDYPVDGDSIWIDYMENVADVLGNNQEYKGNKRVRLKVKEKPFTLIISVLGPVNPEDNDIPIDILTGDITIEKGIVILLDPLIDITEEKLEKTECSMAIYDAVGNHITSCEGLNDNNPKLQMDIVQLNGKYKIAIVWTGQNENSRIVGEGFYLGRITITYPHGNIAVVDAMIGVKK